MHKMHSESIAQEQSINIKIQCMSTVPWNKVLHICLLIVGVFIVHCYFYEDSESTNLHDLLAHIHRCFELFFP